MIFVFYGEWFATQADHNTVSVLNKSKCEILLRGYPGNSEPVVKFKVS